MHDWGPITITKQTLDTWRPVTVNMKTLIAWGLAAKEESDA